jgi:hypothetical protein
MSGWDKYNGKLHLCWQADYNNSAGQQAAMMYYARQRVQLGGVGGNGIAAPDCIVFAYETMAFTQLEGGCNEEYGNLRSLELLYAPKGITTTAVGGFGNGARYPNGSPI